MGTAAGSKSESNGIGAMKNISIDRERLAAFCREQHVKRLALFGSVLRDDFGPESDIDVLVEFEPGHVPGLFGLARLERELSAFFGGRKVDLRTPRTSAAISGKRFCGRQEWNMRKDDRIRLRHMLDAAREALSFAQGHTRRDPNEDRMLVLSL